MRKKNYAILAAIMLLLVVVAGCSKGYEAQRTAGDLKVTLKADGYPLTKGDNTLLVGVAGPEGKAITDANVAVRFYMPPMPGMAPMDTTTQAVLKGDKYASTVNASMEGGWKAEVSVARPGKDPVSTTFNLDAR